MPLIQSANLANRANAGSSRDYSSSVKALARNIAIQPPENNNGLISYGIDLPGAQALSVKALLDTSAVNATSVIYCVERDEDAYETMCKELSPHENRALLVPLLGELTTCHLDQLPEDWIVNWANLDWCGCCSPDKLRFIRLMSHVMPTGSAVTSTFQRRRTFCKGWETGSITPKVEPSKETPLLSLLPPESVEETRQDLIAIGAACACYEGEKGMRFGITAVTPTMLGIATLWKFAFVASKRPRITDLFGYVAPSPHSETKKAPPMVTIRGVLT